MPAGDTKKLAWELAGELLHANRFATLEDTEEILRYHDGVYEEGGESYIKQKIEENVAIKSEVSIHLVNEVIGHVKRSTLKPRAIFEETNPHLVLSNCLLNLGTLEQEPFSPDYYALNKMPVAYDPSNNYRSSRFWSFANEILPPEDVQGVQEELGASLRKEYLTKKLSIWLGGLTPVRLPWGTSFSPCWALTTSLPSRFSSSVRRTGSRSRSSTARWRTSGTTSPRT